MLWILNKAVSDNENAKNADETILRRWLMKSGIVVYYLFPTLCIKLDIPGA